MTLDRGSVHPVVGASRTSAQRLRRIPAAVLLLIGIGCGGGGAGGTPVGALPPPNPGPQIALVAFSGHWPTDAPEPYLSSDTGPYNAATFLKSSLEAAGYTVEMRGFVCSHDGRGGLYPTYDDALAYLRHANTDWIVGRSAPTRIITIGHSHGCSWSHGAARDVPEVPIRMELDFDASCASWSYYHPAPGDVPGVNPVALADLGTYNACGHPEAAHAVGAYDLPDLVSSNVAESWEVRIGTLQFGTADWKWNCRFDGSTTGIFCQWMFLGNHFDIVTPGNPGSAVETARDWVLTHLAADVTP